MTEVSQEEFEKKLLEVVHKLSNIAKTQSYRFKNKWEDYLKLLNDKPHIVRNIPLDKEKFLTDIEYKIEVLKNVENAIVDGFYSIKSLLQTLYDIYFDSELFLKDFSEDDQLVLKYLAAKHILGNLIQYNKMDHESVPMKYNIMARNYTLIKLKGLTDTEILDNLKKLNITDIDIVGLNIIMKEVKAEGIITIKKNKNNNFYELKKELELSQEGKKKYNQVLQPLIDYPTGFWRSFYNIRELNVTPDETCVHREFLTKVLSKSATQGFSPTKFVFANLVKYYEKIKEGSN
ncbi:hypothetical protein LCGC14_1795690 [marine sediment metagenome]|uniref:Uncharacterized protein n=1 Tax=marine sediment metagenome TaxID=412755 RepID=A0A0F9J607_9ZZZZ|nr:hypothetical protein [archaeon]